MKMKDEAQRRRAEALRGLSSRERLEYYRRAHEELVRRQKRLRGLADSPPDAASGPGADGAAPPAGER